MGQGVRGRGARKEAVRKRGDLCVKSDCGSQLRGGIRQSTFCTLARRGAPVAREEIDVGQFQLLRSWLHAGPGAPYAAMLGSTERLERPVAGWCPDADLSLLVIPDLIRDLSRRESRRLCVRPLDGSRIKSGMTRGEGRGSAPRPAVVCRSGGFWIIAHLADAAEPARVGQAAP